MLDRIIETINRYRTFLLTSHIRLDGDALGSELALYHVLKNMGKDALIYNQDRTPDNYRFLPGSGAIVHELPDLQKYDVAVVLDCGDLERIGDKAAVVGRMERIVNIDHHVSNGGFCELTYVDHEASSTGELLYRLFARMAVVPTKDVADNLYAAIITDTGGFRYRHTGKETLLAAGALVGNGADPQWVSENVYENNPIEKILLLSKALESLSFDCNGRVASIVVSMKDLASTGALSEHIEGFVDIPRTVRGVEVSVLYLELAKNYYKLSLRSKGGIDVEKVARRFGGGGHANAAACKITGQLRTIKKRVTEAIGAVL
jgi:bifunctional oligoribonuclease and PAP phosphatase NrnA